MSTPSDTGQFQPPLLSEEEARLRAQLYIRQRINYQDGFYRRRIAEFTFNSDKMLWVSAGLMGISTVISSYSVVADKAFFAFLTALLPAFAAAVSAFRSLYQWQRQATIYEDTWLALQQARLAMPDEDYLEPGDYSRYFPQLVLQTEEVLRGEARQWGQMEQVRPPSPGPAPAPPPAPPPRSGP
ncbi:MAG: hypothetical protein Kow00106_16160 [Anaerolineae bacterium]